MDFIKKIRMVGAAVMAGAGRLESVCDAPFVFCIGSNDKGLSWKLNDSSNLVSQ